MALCEVPGCRHERLPRGPYCNTHKSAKRRHGDPRQRGVTAKELAPHIKALRALMRRNPKSPVWTRLEGLWSALASECEGEAHRAQTSGRAFIGRVRDAQVQLGRVAATVEPLAVVETVVGMFLMREFDPRRFRSDEAFLFQLVRRTRALSDVNAGSYWRGEGRTPKRVYRDLPPATVQTIAELLVEALGLPAMQIAKHESQRMERERHAKEALFTAIEELK